MFINLFPGVISCIGYAFALTLSCVEINGSHKDWFGLFLIFVFSFCLNLIILLNGYNLRLQEEINERKHKR